MVDEQLKILTILSKITAKISLNDFSKMVGLTLNETRVCLRDLVKTGFVKKVDHGYSMAENGKNVLKVINPVPEGMEFRFYTGIDQYTGLYANNLKEFYKLIKKVSVKSLEFHVSRGNFEEWIKNVLDDTQLSKNLARLRESRSSGESLRNEIISVIEARYENFESLLSM